MFAERSASRTWKTILVYGLGAGLLIVALRLVEYRYLVLDHAVDIYGGLIAILFSALGIALGLRVTRPRPGRGSGAQMCRTALHDA